MLQTNEQGMLQDSLRMVQNLEFRRSFTYHKIVFCNNFSNHFKKKRKETILSFQATQKQVAGQIWPTPHKFYDSWWIQINIQKWKHINHQLQILIITLPSNLKGTVAFVSSETETMLYRLFQSPSHWSQ